MDAWCCQGLSAARSICSFATMRSPGCALSGRSRRQFQKAGRINCRCADYTPSRSDQIEQHFAVRSPQFDLPPEAWPGYMASNIRASNEVTTEMEVALGCFEMVGIGLRWR